MVSPVWWVIGGVWAAGVSIDEVPNLVKFLDQTANDLHKDPLEDSAIKAYRPTPQSTATLAGTPTAPEGGTGTPTPRNE